MKEIPLTQNQVALVDDEDYEELSQYRWCAYKHRDTFYAGRASPRNREGKQTTIKMHRVILSAQKGQEVDHKDHNGLNNQRYNIRLATRNENRHNQRRFRSNTTGYMGVSLAKGHRSKPYITHIYIDGEKRYLGYYATAEEAGRAYDSAARELHGEFACLNFPGEKDA